MEDVAVMVALRCQGCSKREAGKQDNNPMALKCWQSCLKGGLPALLSIYAALTEEHGLLPVYDVSQAIKVCDSACAFLQFGTCALPASISAHAHIRCFTVQLIQTTAIMLALAGNSTTTGKAKTLPQSLIGRLPSFSAACPL